MAALSSPQSSASPIRVDMIADFACPWCYLGWRGLAAARTERPDIALELLWRPYQLDPSLPEEGVDRRAYLAAKFPDRSRLSAVHDALVASGAELGIQFNFDAITRAPNTSAAHRLMRWAKGLGLDDLVGEALYAAYFVAGRDIGAPEVLAEIGGGAGMDPLLILDLLSRGADQDAVSRDHRIAVEGGVTGVPFFVFDEKFAAIGAQPTAKLVRIIDHAVAERANRHSSFQVPTNFTN